jgi:hypothetical protein
MIDIHRASFTRRFQPVEFESAELLTVADDDELGIDPRRD